MAKKSKVVKNIQRQELVERYAAKRKELLAVAKNPKSSFSEKRAAYQKLEKMPRDANPIRVRNRCNLTGRPRGVYRRFGLCRCCIFDAMRKGWLVGVRKASW